MLNFDNPVEGGYENIRGKGENAEKPAFSPFHKMISSLSHTNFMIGATFNPFPNDKF